MANRAAAALDVDGAPPRDQASLAAAAARAQTAAARAAGQTDGPADEQAATAGGDRVGAAAPPRGRSAAGSAFLSPLKGPPGTGVVGGAGGGGGGGGEGADPAARPVRL